MTSNFSQKNLNTYYVNLAALLKFLRGRAFVGTVHFEAKGYEADVFFTKNGEIKARENDHLAGRISAGAGVLPRILIRAHEPNGIIDVYDEAFERNTRLAADVEPENIEPVENFEDDLKLEPPDEKPISLKEKLGLANLPFSFGKKNPRKEKVNEDLPQTVEAFAEIEEVPPSSDWEELLNLVGELLQTVEQSLAESNLNFIWVFDKVRAEVFEEYPFLHPNSPVFGYREGKIAMTEQINNNLFVASITESLRRLLEKFQTHPKFDEVRRSVVFGIIELMNKHHSNYDKFMITQQLEKVIDS